MGVPQRAPRVLESQTEPYQTLLSVAQYTVSFVVVDARAGSPEVVVPEIAHKFDTPPAHVGGALATAVDVAEVLQIMRK